jgi:serine protease Do
MLLKHVFDSPKPTKTVAARVMLGIAGASAVLWVPRGLNAETASPPRATAPAPAAILAPVNIADVVERVSPAVVSVRVSAEQPHERQFAAPPGLEEFFERFFGGPQFERGMPGPRRDPSGPRVMQGIGSGFVIDRAGYIVTNNHVVGEADGIEVVLQDGKEYPAKLIGRDTKTDLAVIKIDAGKELPSVSFGRSEDMRVGDWVITVGSPFGLGHTATTGIVSARHRDIGSGPYDDYLQIDAPINPGNSGGPAFNLAGEVIGVNTAIFSPNGGSIGIGFAIPAALAKDVVAQLKEGKTITRGWLGVRIQAVDDDLAAGLGLDAATGAIVTAVDEAGPAANAGVRQGDVIVGVDGKDVTQVRDLPRMVAALTPRAEIELTVWRGGGEQIVTVTIGALPTDDRMAKSESSDDVGLTLGALDQRDLRARGIEGGHGVLIADVKRHSVAARAGLRPGDVILSVAGKDVGEPRDVVQTIRERRAADDKAIVVLVDRGNLQRFVALPLGNA